jgi:hypothetical protein
VGVRLIVEVLDHWDDVGLTAGERGDLLVLAENANDKSRETWGPVHAPHILKRAGKSAPSWRIAINRLMKKKALEYAKRDGKEVRGYTGQHAVYRLVELCPEPPHSGYKGHCTKPEKGEQGLPQGSGEGYPSANPVSEDQEEGYLTANPEGYLTANAVDGLGYLAATERVSSQLTPSPPISSSKETPLTTPSSSVAEDSEGDDRTSDPVTEGGGGGGEIDPSQDQDQDQNRTRAEAFVAELDYRSGMPDRQQRTKLCSLVAAALSGGWSENGLTRYLDISDDPKVRNAASLYIYKLNPDRLPAAADAETVVNGLPPACKSCLSTAPDSKHVIELRRNYLDPINGGPCPRCHPEALAKRPTKLPPPCGPCLDFSPAAEFNVRLRSDRLSFAAGRPCPRCHPSMVEGDWYWPGKDTAKRTGARAEPHTAGEYANSSADDLFAPRATPLVGTDAKVAGWMAIAANCSDEERPKSGPRPMISHQPYRNPADQSVYDQEFPDAAIVDESRYDEEL